MEILTSETILCYNPRLIYKILLEHQEKDVNERRYHDLFLHISKFQN